MSSNNQIRQTKRNKVKSNGSKLCQLKFSDTIIADTEIINLDTSSSSTNTTDNSISESDKSIEQPLTPLINIENPALSEKGVLMLSRLTEPSQLMPNSAIMSLLACDKTSKLIVADNVLDRTQWELESLISSIFELKNAYKDNLQSLSSIKFSDYQRYGITKSSKLSVVKSKSKTNILPVNECNEIKDQIDSYSELTESSVESTEQISKPIESFWTFVKPYLAHVHKNDIKWLRDFIQSYDTNLSEIPHLNEHYTRVWIKEKLTSQNNQPSDHTLLDKSIQHITPNVIEVLNKVNHAVYSGNVSTPIFQRVASALREHAHTSQNDNSKENIEHECIEDNSQDISNFCKQFYKEKNVKNQLINLGLVGCYSNPALAPSISESETDVDEILEELIKCDSALNKLREGNKHELTKLLKKCSVDYHKQKIKNKINKVNSKILKLKKQSNKNLKKKKNALIAKENNQLRLLLDERNNYLLELSELMHSEKSDPNSLSSDEESISL